MLAVFFFVEASFNVPYLILDQHISTNEFFCHLTGTLIELH